MTTTTIEITPVSGTELFHQYPGQNAPQDAQVSLDCATGALTAETDPEIGNAVPMRQYHGHVRCWSIPALTADAANELLEEIEPLAQRVCDGYASRWDGSNHVADFSDDAEAAIEEIAALCERSKADAAEGMGALKVWDADAWFGGIGRAAAQARSLGITATTTDDELAAIETREEESALASGEADKVTGIRRHLEWLRSEMVDAAEAD